MFDLLLSIIRSQNLPVANHAGCKHRPGLDNDPRVDCNFRGEAGVDVPNSVDNRFIADVDVSADLYLVLVTCRPRNSKKTNT